MIFSCFSKADYGPSMRLSHDVYALMLFLASGDFCHLLITFANSLDPNQDRCPDLVSHRLTDTLIVFLKDLFEEKRG